MTDTIELIRTDTTDKARAAVPGKIYMSESLIEARRDSVPGVQAFRRHFTTSDVKTDKYSD